MKLRGLSVAAAILVCLASGLSPALADRTLDPKLEDIVRLARAGKTERARAEVASLLAAEPDEPRALVVLASVALEASDWPVAESSVARLRRLAPGPEVEILAALLATRRQAPQGRWRDAFIAAWLAAGSPNLDASKLLVNPDLLPPDPDEAAWKRAKTSEERLALALSHVSLPMAQRRWLLSQLPQIEDWPTACSAFSSLGSGDWNASEKDAVVRSARSRASALAKKYPGTIQPLLVAALFGTSTESPFDAAELAAIEEASRLTSYRAGDGSLFFSRTRAVLQKLEAEHADGNAFMAFVDAIDCGECMRLTTRTEASRGKLTPADAARLGAALQRIGATRRDDPALLGRLQGYMLLRRGAELAGDEAQAAQAQVEAERLRALSRASAATGVWPLHALSVEWVERTARDEVRHLSDLVPEKR